MSIVKSATTQVDWYLHRERWVSTISGSGLLMWNVNHKNPSCNTLLYYLQREIKSAESNGPLIYYLIGPFVIIGLGPFNRTCRRVLILVVRLNPKPYPFFFLNASITLSDLQQKKKKDREKWFFLSAWYIYTKEW